MLNFNRWLRALPGAVMLALVVVAGGCDGPEAEDPGDEPEARVDGVGSHGEESDDGSDVLDEAAEPDVTVRIDATSPLKFDPLRFTVQPGQLVELELVNVDDMRHNLLIVEPGAREAVVEAAMRMGAEGGERAYVPEVDAVLAATPVLAGGERYTLRFRAPEEPGVYIYVCTYPGHGQVMYGAMYVEPEPEPALVELWEDEHLPEQHRPSPPRDPDAVADAMRPSGAEDWHAYELTYPALYRTVLPGKISAASIAVGLPGGESYAWDAGFSRLRYVWSGDFIDPTPHWGGRGNDRAEIRGQIWYEETGGFPLRFGHPDNEPDEAEVRFGGYTLDEQGYPEFQYEVQGVSVRERIVEHDIDEPGIERTFRIDEAPDDVFFVRPADSSARFDSTSGMWLDGSPEVLKLSPQEAETFIITIEPGSDP